MQTKLLEQQQKTELIEGEPEYEPLPWARDPLKETMLKKYLPEPSLRIDLMEKARAI